MTECIVCEGEERAVGRVLDGDGWICVDCHRSQSTFDAFR